MEKALLMFSGGRDSFLSACLLVERGFRVELVCFDNGCMQGVENAAVTAERLRQKYGADVIGYSAYRTAGLWRELKAEFSNFPLNEIICRWGNVTLSQFNCLSCRAAMYVMAVMVCQSEGISCLATGTRWSQGFGVEQPSSVDSFLGFARTYGISLVLPVNHLTDDRQRKNALLQRGVVPKTIEPQCLIGVPLPAGGLSSESVIAVARCLREHLLPKMRAMMEDERFRQGASWSKIT
ncbi:MAG: hypothetical protein PHT12_03060 [Patescibacteria group bacterium]|nr:hypothetical protein [Patescibacteria group bacterium]